MRKTARRFFNNYKEKQFHAAHNKTAEEALKSIESVKGKTDPALLKEADAYAVEVLGWKGYAPWLYVYGAINGTFKKGWIPDNYYGKFVVPQLKGKYGNIADYNALTSRLFDVSHFPILAYYVNGIWLSKDYTVLHEQQILDLAARETQRLLYKLDSSLQGKGVYFMEQGQLNLDRLKALGNGVLQRYIMQHPFFKEIMPQSVATIRLTSVVTKEGKISIRACYLRVGRSADTHVKSSSHIRIPVNLSTGKLYPLGYTTGWLTTPSHPDTQFTFEDKEIPKLQECVETAIQLHKRVPFTRVIGWDMIVNNEEKVQVMEWNGNHNDIKFSEATQGPCFADLGWEYLNKNI